LLTGCCQQCCDPPASDDQPAEQPNLVAVAEEAAAQDGDWGHIKGRILWGPKDVPVQAPIEKVKDNADKNHCLSKGDVLDEKWVVDKKSRGLEWTMVWLMHDAPKSKSPLPIHPKLKEIKELRVSVDQPICAFIPHVLGMREGQ